MQMYICCLLPRWPGSSFRPCAIETHQKLKLIWIQFLLNTLKATGEKTCPCLSLLLHTVARFWPLRLVWRYRMRLGARWLWKTWIEEFACQGHWGKLLQQEEHTQVSRLTSFLAWTSAYIMPTIVFFQYDVERCHKVHILSCTTWAKGFFEKMCKARQKDGQDACRCVPCHFLAHQADS